MMPKNKQAITISVLVSLLILPMVYLFFKDAGKSNFSETHTPSTSTSSDITMLENLVKTNPDFNNLINLSLAYINNNAPGKSIGYLNKAIELNPNSAIAYNNLGVADIMLQQFQNGIDACTKAIQLDPSFQLAKNNLKWANDEKAKVIASIQIQEHEDAGKKDADFYLAYGLNYFKIGDYGKSIEIWNKVFDIDPKNIAALNNIGTSFMMKGQYDDAIILFKDALKIDLNDQLTQNNLKWALEAKNASSNN